MTRRTVFAERARIPTGVSILEVLARAKELEAGGREIIHLEIGEPDFDTPANITRAAVRALDEGYTHYGPSAGLPEVREAIAKHVTQTRGVDTAAEQVVVTTGAKAAIFFSILALVDPGDEVIYPNPGFPSYEATIKMVGAVPVPMPLVEERDFSIDLDRFASLITAKTKLCILNSPQNPTGGVLPRDVLEGIADLAERHDFYVLTDEIYSRIIYDGTFASYYALPNAGERTVLIDGFSKTYAMTGWRLGYGVMPRSFAPMVAKLFSNASSSTCTFVQRAGIEALTGPQDSVDNMIGEFRARRDLLVDGLNRLPGFVCRIPAGAFYVFPNITGTGMTSMALQEFLLEEAGVAVVAGPSFGEYGEGYIRLSYANSRTNIQTALDGMAAALDKR
ncbi:MAG: pyridoxal phosphate-dependent aminotransferase [Candidatus Latescibacterota bacterium]|nr:MAG: pyridoxal phosphate-dependent aminotransferase [Candidatus Latescibacterota bacterium]